MLREIRPAIVMILLMTVLTGLAYPLAMTGIAQVAFPHQANGSLIEKDKKVIGSELIGQNFTKPGYFHGRPSATTDVDPEGPDQDGPGALQCRQLLGQQCRPDVEGAGRARAGGRESSQGREPQRADSDRPGHDLGKRPRSRYFAGGGPVPGAARGQGAQTRPRTRCASLSQAHTEIRTFGVLGEPRVNVLKLNMALDALKPR